MHWGLRRSVLGLVVACAAGSAAGQAMVSTIGTFDANSDGTSYFSDDPFDLSASIYLTPVTGLQKFDPALGTLTAIHVTGSFDFSSDVEVSGGEPIDQSLESFAEISFPIDPEVFIGYERSTEVNTLTTLAPQELTESPFAECFTFPQYYYGPCFDFFTWGETFSATNQVLGFVELVDFAGQGPIDTVSIAGAYPISANFFLENLNDASGALDLSHTAGTVTITFTYTPACVADTTTTNTNPGDPGFGVPDTVVDGADLSYYIEIWLNVDADADLTTTNTNPGDAAYGTPDLTVDGADLSYYIEQWLGACA